MKTAFAAGHCAGFAGIAARGKKWAVNPHKIQGQVAAIRFRELFGQNRCSLPPKAVINKLQASSSLRGVNELETLVEIWVFRGLIIPPGTMPRSLLPLVKKGHIWGWGSEQQATFEKARIVMRLMKALGISRTGLPFELDVSVTPEGRSQTL